MTDPVDTAKLREFADWHGGAIDHYVLPEAQRRLLHAAADEIDRLRGRLDEIKAQRKGECRNCEKREARIAALEAEIDRLRAEVERLNEYCATYEAEEADYKRVVEAARDVVDGWSAPRPWAPKFHALRNALLALDEQEVRSHDHE